MVYVFQNFLVDIIAFKIFDVWKVTLIIIILFWLLITTFLEEIANTALIANAKWCSIVIYYKNWVYLYTLTNILRRFQNEILYIYFINFNMCITLIDLKYLLIIWMIIIFVVYEIHLSAWPI